MLSCTMCILSQEGPHQIVGHWLVIEGINTKGGTFVTPEMLTPDWWESLL